MAKKKNWFDRMKHFFGADTKSKQEKKERRKRWLFGRLKSKLSPALPATLPQTAKSIREVDDEQNKYAMAVAVATAVAAEAAVAAAQAAAHVVRLTRAPLPHYRRQEIAAMKIQTAFRGYLAKKALRALKGLVRLQALIRGQAVRRQTNTTLRSLQSLMKIQSEAHTNRVKVAADRQAFEDKDNIRRNLKKSRDTRITFGQYSGRNWNSSTLSKEEINDMLKSRIEAALKRERVMGYASSHQGRRNSWRPNTPVAKENDAINQRWSWLDRWAGAQTLDKDIYESDPVPSPEPSLHDQQFHTREPLVLVDPVHKEKADENRLRYLARRSFNRSGHTPTRDDETFTSSPSIPSYMASTASAKARFRSMSTPKQRLSGSEFGATDAYSDHCSPFMNSLLSPFPSAVSEAGVGITGKHLTFHQKSPSVWGQTGPVKSGRSSKYLSFDSECSLVNWERHNDIR